MLGQAQVDPALALGDAGPDAEQSVTQGLGLSFGEVALVGEQHRLGQGEKVSGDQGELDPELIDVSVPGGQVPDAGVLEPSRI